MSGEEESKVTKSDKLSYILLALLAGGGTSLGVRVVDPPRTDPFTGTEGKVLKQEIVENRTEIRRVQKQVDDKLETKVSQIESWLRKYTEEHSDLRYRVLFLEKNLEAMKKKVGD